MSGTPPNLTPKFMKGDEVTIPVGVVGKNLNGIVTKWELNYNHTKILYHIRVPVRGQDWYFWFSAEFLTNVKKEKEHVIFT